MAETIMQELEYKGIELPIEKIDNGKYLYPYIPSPDLVETVNLAIYLERPLLLKGEPGSGKTQLASAVARELNLHFEPWYIKSTSRAQDGLYTYDALSRLRDAQFEKFDNSDPSRSERFKNPESYIRLEQLGKAFSSDCPTVVLIDEIDKADIDFPNDLLLELDEKKFFIKEVSEKSKIHEVKAKFAPIIIITSNDEKELPDAFLRRCLFFTLSFPDKEQLMKIIKTRMATLPGGSSEALIDEALERFIALRSKQDRQGISNKKISTSELIDWVRVLHRDASKSLKQLQDFKETVPYPQVLFKTSERIEGL
jgi:MoxR-like ATPase